MEIEVGWDSMASQTAQGSGTGLNMNGNGSVNLEKRLKEFWRVDIVPNSY